MSIGKTLKHTGKRIVKGSLNFSIKSVNTFLSGVKKKRGFMLIEFLPESRSRYAKNQPHTQLSHILETRMSMFQEQFLAFTSFEKFFNIPLLPDKQSPSRPNFKNYFFKGLDALALYGMLCHHRPKRFIEIGSGYSTKFARQAIQDYGLDTQITSIDPYPRTEIDSICDRVIRQPIESADLSVFEELEANDIVFIDSSHYTLQNSDVTVIFTELLPKLKPGVLVHVHDIFIPWDYPESWVERNYSEQYLLAVMLLSQQPDYDVLFPCYYLANQESFKDFAEKRFTEKNATDRVKVKGHSFWLRKKA